MTQHTRRSFSVAAAIGLGWLCAPVRSARAAAPIPPVPLSFGVATLEDEPVRDAAWIAEQVAQMEALFGPLGVHPERVAMRTLSARYVHLENRADRDALAREVQPGVVNVFIVGTLRDVDEPSRLRRGVHWRNRATPSVRYVIVAAEAMPSVLAHEMGHYFGNGHTATVDNLMSYERTGGPVFLDASQARIIQAAAREAFASGELSQSRP